MYDYRNKKRYEQPCFIRHYKKCGAFSWQFRYTRGVVVVAAANVTLFSVYFCSLNITSCRELVFSINFFCGNAQKVFDYVYICICTLYYATSELNKKNVQNKHDVNVHI